MKKLLHMIFLLFFLSCNQVEKVGVSNIDTGKNESIQNVQGSEEKQAQVNVDLPIEVRLDKIKPLLVKDLSEDKIKAIESELKSAIAASDEIGPEKIFTESLNRFLEEMPDDIMIDMDPSLEKKFKKKWGKSHDVYNINFMHPYSDGNGGCGGLSLMDFDYLGTYNNAYYVEVKILCKMDGSDDTFRRFFKVIEDESTFKIDGVYNF
jgi:hypothetical protein